MKDLFPIQYSEELDRVQGGQDVFAGSIAEKQGAAQQRNKNFLGGGISESRFKLGLLGVSCLFLLLLARTASLQILSGEEFRALAEQNRLWHRTIPSERGIIYDREGVVLVENEPVFNIFLPPESVPERDDLQNWMESLAPVLDETYQSLHTSWLNKEEEMPLRVKSDAPYDLAMAIHSDNDALLGLYTEIAGRRSYITDEIPSLSHILGYTAALNEDEYQLLREEGYRSYDHIGKQGVEETYESILRGEYGTEVMEVDALGSTLRIIRAEDAVQGENLTLTIDAEFQRYVEQSLTERLEETPASRASVVVMNPTSGEIYSMVSWPSYDANAFTEGISRKAYQTLTENENVPLFPRAFAGEFPSGSTIKPIHAATALMEEIITPTTSFLSTGGLNIGPWFFPDWRPGGHGVTNVYHAIADSVNTYFYIIGGGDGTFDGLGIETMMDYAALYGFGSPTGLDIDGEADGFLPSIEWKETVKNEPWYIGDTYHVAIGQGDFLSTPLQLTKAIAVFANGGFLVTPHVASTFEPTSKDIIPRSVVEVIRDAMRRTVTQGSAQYLNSLPIEVAGKTGTAQWSSVNAPHSWFTGFAPFDEPEVVVTVLIEEGGDDYLAVPVTHDILNWWFTEEKEAPAPGEPDAGVE